jgi:hypothetical protein
MVGQVGASSRSGAAKPAKIDTHDHALISDEANEEPTGATGASGQPNLGLPGVHSGPVYSSLGGGSTGPKGVHSGGVVVSGGSPNFSYLSGSAGKLFS